MNSAIPEFDICPRTGGILLSVSTDYDDPIYNRDITAEILATVIKKIGVGNQIKVGGVKSKWSITVTDDSVMDVSVVNKTGVAAEKKTVIKKLAETSPVYTADLPGLELSPALQKVIGKGPMPRSEIVAKLWQYIKSNELQDVHNKRSINCDKNLKKVFGKDSVSMFEMAGLIGKHVGKIE